MSSNALLDTGVVVHRHGKKGSNANVLALSCDIEPAKLSSMKTASSTGTEIKVEM